MSARTRGQAVAPPRLGHPEVRGSANFARPGRCGPLDPGPLHHQVEL